MYTVLCFACLCDSAYHVTLQIVSIRMISVKSMITYKTVLLSVTYLDSFHSILHKSTVFSVVILIKCPVFIVFVIILIELLHYIINRSITTDWTSFVT